MTARLRLSLADVAKRYGKAAVLDGVSLEVASGEIVVVCGPSGGGKTVLLRLIAGTDAPDRGEIRIDGKLRARPRRRGARRRHGVPELRALPAPHAPTQNIASPLRGARPGPDRDQGSGSRRSRPSCASATCSATTPRELSNGQKQRTSLARALVRGPGVLLLDDPLRNVDAKLRYEMRLELPRLLASFGSAVIYVTQDYREAMALGRRIAVLRRAASSRSAPPAAIYGEPANVEIARLFGDPTINLYRCRPRRRRGRSCSASGCRWSRHGRAGRPRGRDRHPGRGHRGRAGARCPARCRPSSTQ